MATESESSDGFEQIILKLADCFVFKIPPLRSASGHRAESWDLEKPLFIGYLRIYQNDKKLCVRIYKFKNSYSKTPTDDNLAFFAECPVEIQPKEPVTAYIDTVVDSSRYFVLKMKDRATGRTAQMGIGFLDRDPAFEFKNCLNEYIRYVSRMNVAAGESTTDKDGDTEGIEDGMHSSKMDNQDGNDDEDDEYNDTNQPSSLKQQQNNISSDLSIKPGAKIKIKSLGVHRTLHNTHNDDTHAVSKSSSINSTADDRNNNNNNTKPTIATTGLLLAPPPTPVSKSLSLLSPPPPSSPSISTENTNESGVDNNNGGIDDDWGDFETA